MLKKLTKREDEIYKLLLKGKNIAQIAQELYIEKVTVDTHKQSIYKKKAVNSIQQLLAQRVKELENLVVQMYTRYN